MNSYLRPLVKELNSLSTDGFSMLHKGNTTVIHAVLLATVCDIPATAKLGGFVSHGSKMHVGNVQKFSHLIHPLNVLIFQEMK